MHNNTKARSFLTVIIIIAFVALFLRFSSVQIIKWTIDQNEANAQESLKLVSTALELYAKDHMGMYPQTLNVLIQSKQAYINKEYIAESGTRKGYVFACSRLEQSGYSCSANPRVCGLTGKKVFSVTTGGSWATEECLKNEQD
jgi:type II secretory pathway pseudopilin PulG